jgi:hypothetical protein
MLPDLGEIFLAVAKITDGRMALLTLWDYIGDAEELCGCLSPPRRGRAEP